MSFSGLPTEILSHILQQVDPHTSTQPCSLDIDTIRAATQVNQIWHALAVPILYRKINIESTSTPHPRCDAYRILRLLQAKPEYGKHVRHLNVVFQDPHEREIRLLAYIIEKCRFVHTLSLEAFVNVNNCTVLLDQIVDKKLHRVNLKGECRDILAQWVKKNAPVNAEILTVDDELPSLEDNVPPCFAWSEIEKLSIDAKILPTDVDGCWQAPLKAFRYNISLSRIIRRREPSLVPTFDPQALFEIHRETLEIVELLSWRSQDVNTYVFEPDFSDCMSLKTLRLHMDSILKVPPQQVSSKLPSGLCKLELDVMESERTYKVWVFESSDIRWLKTFFSIRQQTIPDHQLKSIMVHYTFNDEAITHCRLTGYVEDYAWPCTPLDEAASALKSYGVILAYPKPYMDRAAWKTMIRDQTVPGWEYYTTKEERMAVRNAEVDEEQHFSCGDYIHGEHECRRIEPLPGESDESTQLFEVDGIGCHKICSYFNRSCRHEHPNHTNVVRVPETPEAATMRRDRNFTKGFTICHDCSYLACAKTIAQEQRWEELCKQRQLFA